MIFILANVSLRLPRIFRKTRFNHPGTRSRFPTTYAGFTRQRSIIMQTFVVLVILALAGVYLFARFRRSVSGGGCGCGCSCSKKGGCASCATSLEPLRIKKHPDSSAPRS